MGLGGRAGNRLWRPGPALFALVGLSVLFATSSGASSGPVTSTSGNSPAPHHHVLDRPARVCVPRGTRTACLPWHGVDQWSGRTPSVYVNSFAPGASQPGVRAYAAWIRTSTTSLGLYPGYEGPGTTSLSRGPEEVPPGARASLLATFNSGFYEADGPAGFFTHGTLYFPMRNGLATLVRYRNGGVDIMNWNFGPRPPAGVVMARQNLPLLVNNSRPTPLTTNNAAWGLTLYGAPKVWRTAIGIDPAGNLIYLAAPNQTAASLAALMVMAHCVRAMELDINPEWPIFVTYATRGAGQPSLFVPNPNQIPGRFLYPSTKDFFAVYRAPYRGAAAPW